MEEIQTIKKQIAEIEKLAQETELDKFGLHIKLTETQASLIWNLEDAKRCLAYALADCRSANNK